MTEQQILEILKTREQIAKANGNSTELSLIYELVKMVEGLKEIKAVKDEE